MEDAKLIESLRKVFPLRDMTAFNVLDVLHAEGSPLLALLYSRLFWPEFAEIDGMVFLRETVEDDSDRDRLREAFERYGCDRTKTEQAFNLHELEEMFGRRLSETSDDEDRELADRLQQMWHARLLRQFPGRRFRIEIVEPEETSGSVGLQFWTERS